MKEIYNLRLKAEHAELLLGAGWEADPRNARLSETVVQVKGIVGDDLYAKARKRFFESSGHGGPSVIHSCRIERTYTKKEIDSAELFLVLSFYQYGAAEEYGTWYTDAPKRLECGISRQEVRVVQTSPFQCAIEDKKHLNCALGSRQVGPLHYPFGKLTKRDLISLWGGETVVSARFASLIEDGGFTGGRLDPIWNTARGAKALPALAETPAGAELIARAAKLGMKVSDREFWRWIESPDQLSGFEKALWEEKKLVEAQHKKLPAASEYLQLRVESRPLVVAEQTVLHDPLLGGLQHHCQCESGEMYGRLCSRLFVKRVSWDGADICQTDLFFGGRQGLFRPCRQLIVSKKLFDAMIQSKIRKFEFEIVEMI